MGDMAEEELDNITMSEGEEEIEEAATQDTEGPARRKAKPSAKPANPCLVCRKSCTKAQYSVKCTPCENWCHKSCAGLSDEAFKGLNLQIKEVGTAFWACKSCLSYATKVNHQFKKANERIDQVEKKADENKKEIESTLKLAKETASTVSELTKRIDNITEKMEETLDNELRERECRKTNLIIHGLPEVPSTVVGNRECMEADKRNCDSVFGAIGARTRAENMRFCRRVGERGGASRPLVVGLCSEGEKNFILSRARDLQHTAHKDVTTVPDLTKRQRAGEEKLREEANRRNDQLNQEDLDRGMKWMVVGRRGERRLIKGAERDPGYQSRENQGTWQQIPFRSRGANQTSRRAGEQRVDDGRDRADQNTVIQALEPPGS